MGEQFSKQNRFLLLLPFARFSDTQLCKRIAFVRRGMNSMRRSMALTWSLSKMVSWSMRSKSKQSLEFQLQHRLTIKKTPLLAKERGRELTVNSIQCHAITRFIDVSVRLEKSIDLVGRDAEIGCYSRSCERRVCPVQCG